MKNGTDKEAFWRGHIEQCGMSNKSQQDYCRHHDLALSTFGYWKKKLGSRSEKARFYPLVVSGEKNNSSHRYTGISLHMETHHLRIEFEEEFSAPALKRLVAALEDL